MSERPCIYFDFGSPYAYLAVERAGQVLASEVDLKPVLLGALFKRRGWGSWAETDQRSRRIAEIEARAVRYGLPPLRWPAVWPSNSLAANRAAICAIRLGLGGPFVRALFRRQFAQGADIANLDVLAAAAIDVGLERSEL